MPLTSEGDSTHGKAWALILAAGEGTRLRALTTTETGVAVPKQFCSLRGESSLLDETVSRARGVVSNEQICTVVAAGHQRWWAAPLAPLQPDNIIVQPRNRGTANGILLPLLHILARDANARIVILPSDHHFQDEAALQRSIRDGLDAMDRDEFGIALLGIAPEYADPELGYVVPGRCCGGSVFQVSQFIEKPSAAAARSIIKAGGLWNTFILIARASALLQLIGRQRPGLVAQLQNAVQQSHNTPGSDELSALYERLDDFDFSRHVAQPAAAAVRVIRAPQCGWSDLGTPRRVAEVLVRPAPLRAPAPARDVTSYLNLSEQLARFAPPLASQPRP